MKKIVPKAVRKRVRRRKGLFRRAGLLAMVMLGSSCSTRRLMGTDVPPPPPPEEEAEKKKDSPEGPPGYDEHEDIILGGIEMPLEDLDGILIVPEEENTGVLRGTAVPPNWDEQDEKSSEESQ